MIKNLIQKNNTNLVKYIMVQSIKDLKIYPHLNAIIQKISKFLVVTVVAPTGTGKSIGIPYEVGKSARIFVSVPTITAAVSLFNYQKQINPNIKVGYAAEGRIRYNKNSRIVYATSGHVRRKLLNHIKLQVCQRMDFTDVLMIYEAHTGTIDVSVIRSLWNYCSGQGSTVPRLVLSSATLNTDPNKPNPALGEIYQVDINHHPINILYTNKDYNIGDNRLYDDTVTVIKNNHGILPITNSFLIFAPGQREIKLIIQKLGKLNNALILPAYGELSIENIQKISDKPPLNIRKIVVATNIVETAVTIENVGLVVDTLIEKIAESSPAGGLRLKTHFISKASATQRCGRTGRTNSGICYRMMTQTKYNTLPDQRKQEIERAPIHRLVIEFLNVGLKPENIIPGLSKERADKAVKLLKQLGMVDLNNDITKMGKFVVQFPLGVKNASLIWYWKEQKLPLFPIVVIATLIDSYSPPYFIYPNQTQDETLADYQIKRQTHEKNYFLRFKGESSLATMINWWSDLMNDIGGPDAPSDDIKDWAVRNSVNNKKLSEVFNVIRQSRIILQKMKLTATEGPFTTDGAINALTPIIRIVYSDSILNYSRKTNKGIIYSNPMINDTYRLDDRMVSQSLSYPPGQLAALSTFTIHARSNIINVELNLTPPINNESEKTQDLTNTILELESLLVP